MYRLHDGLTDVPLTMIISSVAVVIVVVVLLLMLSVASVPEYDFLKEYHALSTDRAIKNEQYSPMISFIVSLVIYIINII